MTVREIRVQGATLLSPRSIRKLVGKYEGQCLNLDGINAVLQTLTNAYVERGNVTSRAVLGPQDLGTGVLEIQIIEGRVESIGPDAASSMQPRQFLTIFPGVQGSVLQLRDIEQGLEQLNRLPSNNAAMRIEPGAKAGASRVLISNVQKRTWRLSAGVDNLGRKAQASRNTPWALRKIIFWAAMISSPYTGPAPCRRVAGPVRPTVGGLQRQPVGSVFRAFRLLAAERQRQPLQLYHPGFRTESGIYQQRHDNRGPPEPGQVVWRDAAGKLSLGGFIQYRDVVNRFEGERLVASSYRLTHRGPGSRLCAAAAWRCADFAGRADLGIARHVLEPARPVRSDTPHVDFSKTTGTLGWYRPFNVGEQQWAWTLSAYGQTSEQTLYGSERLYLGSSYTVRGFKETPVGGDLRRLRPQRAGLDRAGKMAAHAQAHARGPGAVVRRV